MNSASSPQSPLQTHPSLKWIYRLTTALIVLWMIGSGVGALIGVEEMTQTFARLGYPLYIALWLGIAKLLEAAALTLPLPARLREWAYAAASFEVILASLSYLAVGATAAEVAIPLIFLVLIQSSFWSWQRLLGQRQALRSHASEANIQDKNFVKLYRTLNVDDARLTPLERALNEELISPSQDLFCIRGPEQSAVAITLWNLAYHHIAQGRLAQEPFVLSFCPVCNSGMVFDPRVNGQELSFQVGGVYGGTMIMRDAQTGSYWHHITGECVEGHYKGEALTILSSHELLSAERALALYPSLRIATARLTWWQELMTSFQNNHTWRALPEGKFYPGFKASFLFEDTRRPEKELGVGVWTGKHARFYPLEVIQSASLLEEELEGVPFKLSYDAELGMPDHSSTQATPLHAVFTRWYGFAQTFPGCEVFSAASKTTPAEHLRRSLASTNATRATPLDA